MGIYLNLKSLNTKLSISIFVIIIFYFLYNTIPDNEFENVTNQNCQLERLYFTVTNQIGIRECDSLKPISSRAKILTMVQILLSYSILLL